MPEIRYAEQFIEDMSQVKLARKRSEVRKRIEQLSDFPNIGSSNVPASIARAYGPSIRKLVVSPFLIVYEVNEAEDAIDVLALIHQRAAW